MTAAPTRRRASLEPAPPFPAGRALLRERGGRASYRLEFDVRTAYDFVISLASYDDEHGYDRLPEDERWLAASRAALSEAQRRDLDLTFGKSGLGYRMLSLAFLHPEVRDARSLVELLATMPAPDYARAVLELELSNPEIAPLLERSLAGDRSALRVLGRHLPEGHAVRIVQLLRDPEAAVQRLRGLLGAWLPHFEAVEPRLRQILERDLELRRVDRETLPPDELIERTTGGLRFVPDPRVQRVVLAPSYFERPFNEVEAGHGWRLFCYPVADAALPAVDELAPPPQVLRLFRALGDASRLRILRLLADQDLYLTEIAQALELSKPTIKHHLAQLRAAGLVTVVEERNLTYYSLRRERLQEAGTDLRGYLG